MKSTLIAALCGVLFLGTSLMAQEQKELKPVQGDDGKTAVQADEGKDAAQKDCAQKIKPCQKPCQKDGKDACQKDACQKGKDACQKKPCQKPIQKGGKGEADAPAAEEEAPVPPAPKA